MDTSEITYGSLFSGVGGFDLAFDRVGFKGMYQVEIDKHARSVLDRHWPDVPKFDDVKKIGSHNLPWVNIICGGFPCTDVSNASMSRDGLAGTRSGLFYEMVRIVDETQPDFLVWENVPGLLSSDQGRDFARVLSSLADIGYFGAYRILDAKFFGIAQRRRRIFGVFAHRDIGARYCAEILAISESSTRRHKPTKQKEKLYKPIHASTTKTNSEIAYELMSNRIVPTLTANTGGFGRMAGTPVEAEFLVVMLNKDNELVLRRCTPSEADTLQGFPADWTRYRMDGSEQADTSRYRQLGNAIAIPCAEYIARRMARFYQESVIEA